ncbi:MAG: DEAD/DEAH box helicase [Formivibrio sp.]|nr:DEAD/DEAH box helicase [Formivibrio sp.]
MRAQDRTQQAAIDAFARAGEAIESVVRDGEPDFNERGFYTIIAAAAYHLAHFSARAFSLFPNKIENLNLSPSEYLFTLLLRRDLRNLRTTLVQASGEVGFDATLATTLDDLTKNASPDENTDGAEFDQTVYLTLNAIYHQALAVFDYALDAGSGDAVGESLAILDEGVSASVDFDSVPFWWIFTVTRHLLEDLWDQSLHVRLPIEPDGESPSEWSTLRRLFIAKMQKHKRSEIELWPSQLGAASRALDTTDDIVAALPTSAGKTRIAEICILRALSLHQRIVFVTPLRALSAQTERALRQTFAPLGFSVSSLYGSSGSTGDDVDSLLNRDIVVSTPEKLDFALRNDPDLIDNVGLIVLDEAHTIGAGEREVRYEVLVQRLLRRADAGSRRIVCLSAILPQGEQLEDFVAWIRQDQPGVAETINWRPTRQRFGEIRWDSNNRDAALSHAVLSFRIEGVGDDAPYVNPFISIHPPLGQQTKNLPRDRRDLCLMSAWRLVEEGQTVLIYCPERRSVTPYAKGVLDLIKRGYLKSLLDCDPALLTDALNIGSEWLGNNHPAVQCLQHGVAVHHGQLPRPFLRAMERLLKDQLLKVTIASPTLAQGLNLSATTVLFSSLKRGMGLITGEEFANVAGRAGRAFVDVEGQVICIAWERKQLREWDGLLKAARERLLKSGLLQLIIDFCKQLEARKGYSISQVLEYITGNVNVWVAPKSQHLHTEDELKEQTSFEKKWQADLASLDSAILSIAQHDVPLPDLASAIDEALRSSLWERSLRREDEATRNISKAFLEKRAAFIWANSTAVQRKGYFFAGISFNTGQYLDQHADVLNGYLLVADTAFAGGELVVGIKAIIELAKIVFQIKPFEPDDLPDDWEDILSAWVSGASMSDLAGGQDADVLEFIEGALVYRLVWAMEAVRVRQTAVDDEYEPVNGGRAALAVETGTPNYCAALLIQSGLPSRVAATKAVVDCPADFSEIRGLKYWLRSDDVRSKQAQNDWPTVKTSSLWRSFVDSFQTVESSTWAIQDFELAVQWNGVVPAEGTNVRVIYEANTKRMQVRSVGLELLGSLPYEWETEPCGIVLAKVSDAVGNLLATYYGPKDLFE